MREWDLDFPVDIRLTLSALAMGRRDPCHQVGADGSVWRTARMASGPATYRLRQLRADRVEAAAWGPGGEEALEAVPDLLGRRDRPETFVPGHPLLEDAVRRLPGLRVPRTGLLLEALVGAILHQKVSGRDAVRSWCEMVGRHGAPAPGPRADLRLAPTAAEWLEVPPWSWRRAGVEPSAVAAVRLAASRSTALERAASVSLEEAYRAMTSLPGIGPWTAAEVGHRALGDSDALSVGDYHIASLTGWALAGGTLEESEVEPFYERWRPHRYRVMRLLELTPSAWPPRHGPRMARPAHRYGPY